MIYIEGITMSPSSTDFPSEWFHMLWSCNRRTLSCKQRGRGREGVGHSTNEAKYNYV